MTDWLPRLVARIPATVHAKLLAAFLAMVVLLIMVGAPLAAQTILGMDVSHYNGTINWAQVSAAGKVFAYIKATEGVSYTADGLEHSEAGIPSSQSRDHELLCPAATWADLKCYLTNNQISVKCSLAG